MIAKRNFAELFDTIADHWNPRIAAELNGQCVKLVKFKGDFVWHAHEDEDEMFYVLEGRFTMELRDGNVELGPGDFIVIPRGIEHRPVAPEECSVVLFEPATTVNTGDIEDKLTRRELERI
jgi:mannose-6-phosphate isomerase-like protein (cupin superfamily)